MAVAKSNVKLKSLSQYIPSSHAAHQGLGGQDIEKHLRFDNDSFDRYFHLSLFLCPLASYAGLLSYGLYQRDLRV